MTREPGNLLEAVWIDIFRRKGSVQCTAPFVDGGSVHVYPGLVLFGERVPFCGDIEHVKQTKENANMKKVFSLLLALVCILSLTACGGRGGQYEIGDVQAMADAGAFSEELEELDGDVAFSALYRLGDYGLEREDLTPRERNTWYQDEAAMLEQFIAGMETA